MGCHDDNFCTGYRGRGGGPRNGWVKIGNKGRMSSLDSSEVRALTSRYGDPKELLAGDWVSEIPGIDTKGRYDDYAKDPWKTVTSIFKRVDDGTYEYFYPAGKQAVRR